MVLYYLTCFRASEAKIESERGIRMVPIEAIDRLIDDFRTRIEKLEPFKGVPAVDAAIRVYNAAVNELGKVVEDYGPGKP